MTDLDILHFEQLKRDVQAQYLKEYTPSYDDISKWKGIDIIYFQEDLRKKAKGNISEKSFYTYFKTSPVTKLPRIDMLNLLSIYAGVIFRCLPSINKVVSAYYQMKIYEFVLPELSSMTATGFAPVKEKAVVTFNSTFHLSNIKFKYPSRNNPIL